MRAYNRKTWPGLEFSREIFHLNSEDSGGGGETFQVEWAAWYAVVLREKMLGLETEIWQVCPEYSEWVNKMSGEVVRGHGPNLMLF